MFGFIAKVPVTLSQFQRRFFPRQIVDVLVVVNREHLPTIRYFHEYLQPFYGEATNIEDIHTIMNWNLQDPRPSTVQNDRGMNLPGTNYDNTRRLSMTAARLSPISHDDPTIYDALVRLGTTGVYIRI